MANECEPEGLSAGAAFTQGGLWEGLGQTVIHLDILGHHAAAPACAVVGSIAKGGVARIIPEHIQKQDPLGAAVAAFAGRGIYFFVKMKKDCARSGLFV